MPHRVGTLDTRRLAVHQNADGTLFFREDAVRVKVHGNTRWTTLRGVSRRGQANSPPSISQQAPWHDSESSDSSDGSDDDEEQPGEDDEQQLARAIAASLAQHSVPNGGGVASPVDQPALDQMGDDEQMRLAIAASLASDGGGRDALSGSAPAVAQVEPVAPSPSAAPAAPTCSICMEDLASGGQVQALRCSHSFHRACISRWLRSSRTCPTCRERA